MEKLKKINVDGQDYELAGSGEGGGDNLKCHLVLGHKNDGYPIYLKTSRPLTEDDVVAFASDKYVYQKSREGEIRKKRAVRRMSISQHFSTNAFKNSPEREPWLSLEDKGGLLYGITFCKENRIPLTLLHMPERDFSDLSEYVVSDGKLGFSVGSRREFLLDMYNDHTKVWFRNGIAVNGVIYPYTTYLHTSYTTHQHLHELIEDFSDPQEVVNYLSAKFE